MRILATITLFIAVSAARAAPPQADGPAQDVIKVAIDAAGGEKTLKKYKGGTIIMKCKSTSKEVPVYEY